MNQRKNPYLIFNLINAGIIVLIILYSGIFSASGISHPIKSQYTHQVVSTGLSRAFSEIVRLNFDIARAFNPYSIKIFLFFFIQLFMRIGISIMLLSRHISEKVLVYSDILISVLLFLWAFSKFILQQFINY